MFDPISNNIVHMQLFDAHQALSGDAPHQPHRTLSLAFTRVR